MISRLLLESCTQLNAQEIYDEIKEYSIGIATVYKNVKLFKILGIVKEFNINSISYYEIKIFSEKPLHIHFKCLKCNSIIDINNINLNLQYLNLDRNIEHRENLQIYDINILFLGLCSKCKEEDKCQDQQSLEE
ncbi:transcriptional repressor [Clostridium sp. Marseille-Q2269]|uniref:Fur family transcriptional regulator n=1 Tax=Clostridium sp. Marseille-Q2269 TaxID=2942205 RepID=UPI0033655801